MICVWIAAGLGALIAAWGCLYAHRDRRAVSEWRASGHPWITEGLVKKGGLNGPSAFPRPPAPSAMRSTVLPRSNLHVVMPAGMKPPRSVCPTCGR